MREMLLLGAGASVEAGVPDAYAMTTRIIESFDPGATSPDLEWIKHPLAPQLSPPLEYGRTYNLSGQALELFKTNYPIYHVLTFVVGGLLMQRGIDGRLPEGQINVEELFSAVELLSQRNQLEASPFVGSWHPMVDILDDRYSDHFAHRYYPSQEYRFWNTLRIPVAGYGRGEVFLAAVEEMVKRLRNIVWIDDPAKVDYLAPIAALARQQGSLAVATLNYDNGIELMSKACELPCATEITEWSTRQSFLYDNEGISLLKLHGSVDWSVTATKPDAERKFPTYTICEVRPNDDNKAYAPALVFGQRNKLKSEGPFLDLLGAFRRKLSDAEKLTIVGYSLRDGHVNEEIKRWVNLRPDAKIRIVDPGFNTTGHSFGSELARCCTTGLEIIREKAGAALRRLYV
jgi:hypothetical protein